MIINIFYINLLKLINWLFLIILLFAEFPSFAAGINSSMAAGSAINAEAGLKLSHRLITLVDSSVSNLGSEENKNLYKKIILDDLIARVYLRQFQYSKSYKSTKRVHKNISALMADFIKKHNKECLTILNSYAPDIIHKQNAKAKHYLRLSYRDITLAEQIITKADHITPKYLYSLKAQKYLKAIMTVKRAMKFAMLAILEINTPKEERRAIERLSFEEMGSKLWYILKTNRARIISIHFDNYNRFRNKSLKEVYFMDKESHKALTKGTAIDTPTAR